MLNEQLQHRNVELSQVNRDLNNLFNTIQIPILMLGDDLRIRRLNPAAEKVWNIIPTDLDRMPKMDGYTLAKQLRQLGHQTPIIIISGEWIDAKPFEELRVIGPINKLDIAKVLDFWRWDFDEGTATPCGVPPKSFL